MIIFLMQRLIIVNLENKTQCRHCNEDLLTSTATRWHHLPFHIQFGCPFLSWSGDSVCDDQFRAPQTINSVFFSLHFIEQTTICPQIHSLRPQTLFWTKAALSFPTPHCTVLPPEQMYSISGLLSINQSGPFRGCRRWAASNMSLGHTLNTLTFQETKEYVQAQWASKIRSYRSDERKRTVHKTLHFTF